MYFVLLCAGYLGFGNIRCISNIFLGLLSSNLFNSYIKETLIIY